MTTKGGEQGEEQGQEARVVREGDPPLHDCRQDPHVRQEPSSWYVVGHNSKPHSLRAKHPLSYLSILVG